MATQQTLRYIRKPGQKAVKQREKAIQQAICRYLNRQGYDFYCDWASGAYLTMGQNTARAALASRRGWVDLFIAEPRRGYHGLFLEVKNENVKTHTKDGQVVANTRIRAQDQFLRRQADKGYCALFVHGIDEAKDKIDWYFDNPQEVELPF